MTTTKATITNVQALKALVSHAKATGYDNAEVLAKVEHHIKQLDKPRPVSTLPSKTQRLNARLVEEVADFMRGRPAMTTQAIVDGIGSPDITTPQKATILLGMLASASDHRVERLCVKGRVMWHSLEA